MRKIKNFNSFNEGISGIDTLKNKYDDINKEDLSDRLLEISDLGVEVSETITKVTDKNGKEILEKSDEYYLSYYFRLSYNTDIFIATPGYFKNSSLFTKNLNNLSTVLNTIESVIKNISKIYNLNISNSEIYTTESVLNHKIVLTSKNMLPIEDFNKTYQKYGKTIEGKCHLALSKIKKYFIEKTGIKYPDLDFNWDMMDSEYGMHCGYFDDDDDVTLIATYDPKTNKIYYDNNNIEDLI